MRQQITLSGDKAKAYLEFQAVSESRIEGYTSGVRASVELFAQYLANTSEIGEQNDIRQQNANAPAASTGTGTDAGERSTADDVTDATADATGHGKASTNTTEREPWGTYAARLAASDAATASTDAAATAQ